MMGKTDIRTFIYNKKMKKTIILLLAVILSLTLLAGCDGRKNEPIPEPIAATEAQTDSPGETDIPNEPKTFLDAGEAREIAQAWLDDHPIKEPNILESEYDSLTVDGEEFYMFFPDSHEMYWFSILVHKETGELLSRTRSDGESPIEEIEPLDDWYFRFFP